MKRSGPLRRGKPMKRGPGPQRRKRIAPISDKARAKIEPRRELRRRLLQERPWCEVGPDLQPLGVECLRRSTDLHERLRRSQGGDILDGDDILCVCRNCHRWITENPQAAVEMGHARWSWQKDSKE